ncbi:hypothetical protein I315_02554 [Cryptococcus gattii Ru294]|nr:hypothetical protein I315_02554 [Cryptococcus gattii Ru294]
MSIGSGDKGPEMLGFLLELSHRDEPSSPSPTGDGSGGAGAGFGNMPITRFSTSSSSFPNSGSNLDSDAKSNPFKDEKPGNKGRRSMKNAEASQAKSEAGDVSISEDEYEENSNEEGGKFSIGDDEEGGNL